MPVKGTYLAIAGGGAVLLWSGLKGKSWSAVLRNIISGQNPLSAPNVNPVKVADYTGTGNPNATAQTQGSIQGTVSGSGIAEDAVTYKGHCYVYGGAPGPNGTNCWDCSSFVNWVLNHDLDQPIPGYGGYQWNPATHGPATTSYLTWPVSHVSRSQVQAGDLCLWLTHIGIAINNQQMISALNPSLGTEVTGIEAGGPSGEPVIFLRVAALCRLKEPI